MTGQQLKNSILQLAVQGKLVPQDPGEGNAHDLYKNLLSKKNALLSEGKIAKKRPTKPFYSEAELESFSIPDSWEWVQLSDISLIQEGAGIRKWQYSDSGVQILCVTNILDGRIDLNKKKLYISNDEYNEKYTHLTLHNGDIVTACSGGSWGKVAIFESENTIMLNTSTLRLRFLGDLGENKYLYYICQSQFFKKQLQQQLSGMQPNFGYAHYSRIMIPLPPIAEQMRIVAKVEELLPFVERYARAETKLETLNTIFPDQLKKSILQEAIQGKLVPQDPADEPASALLERIRAEKEQLIKDGKIKREKNPSQIFRGKDGHFYERVGKNEPICIDDQLPFEIPKSWEWARLETLYNFIDYRGSTPTKISSGVPLITAKNVKKGFIDHSIKEYISEKEYSQRQSRGISRKGDILFTTEAPLGNAALADLSTFSAGQRLITFQQYGNSINLSNTLMVYFILSDCFQSQLSDQSTGTTVKGIKASKLKQLLIPLPPLAEQQRIVAKLEQLNVFIGQLANS